MYSDLENVGEYKYNGSGKRVLIVEDDDYLREVSEQFFDFLGFKVWAVSKAEEAIQLIDNKDFQFDLLFLDIFLKSEINGFEIGRYAKGLRDDVELIFTSGVSKKELLNVMQDDDNALGPLVSKPVDIIDLSKFLLFIFKDSNMQEGILAE